MNIDLLDTTEVNPEYAATIDEVEAVRDALMGEMYVKAKGQRYLPPRSMIDTTSQEALQRYERYLMDAEFEEIPAQTLISLQGKLQTENTVLEFPQRIEYLISDVDKDGLSFYGMLNEVCGEVLAMKWTLLLADYQGLSDLDIENVSVADLEQANPRATIKQYSRENVLDWRFERINGVMQLTYAKLRETGYQANRGDDTRTSQTRVSSYLVLALDEDGNYYQRKFVRNSKNSGYIEGDRSYVTVNGAPLRWIPAIIVSDNEYQSGKIPMQMGYLSGIISLTYYRYRLNADYKEAMAYLPPTTHIKGITNTGWEQFKQINGRDYVATGAGAVNVWPGEADVQVIGANTQLEGYERYLANNEKRIRALGGVFPTDDLRQRTATEVATESKNQADRLNPLVASVEAATTKIVSYCAMFEGLTSPETVEQFASDNIVIKMPREFAASKLTSQEVESIAKLYDRGLLPRSVMFDLLEQGGVIDSAADTLEALENEPPLLTTQ